MRNESNLYQFPQLNHSCMSIIFNMKNYSNTNQRWIQQRWEEKGEGVVWSPPPPPWNFENFNYTQKINIKPPFRGMGSALEHKYNLDPQPSYLEKIT